MKSSETGKRGCKTILDVFPTINDPAFCDGKIVKHGYCRRCLVRHRKGKWFMIESYERLIRNHKQKIDQLFKDLKKLA